MSEPHPPDTFEYKHQVLLLEDVWVKIQMAWFARRRQGIHPPPALRVIIGNTLAGAGEATGAMEEIMALSAVFEDTMIMAFQLGQHCGKNGIEPIECPCGERFEEERDGDTQSPEDSG